MDLKTPKGHFEIKITYQGSEWQNWLDYSSLYRDVSKKGLFNDEFCFLTYALNILAVFLKCQLWIVNDYVKS